MKRLFSLIGLFRSKPELFVSMNSPSPQEALDALRAKAKILRAQAVHFCPGSTIYQDSLSRATAAEQAVVRCVGLLERQDYSTVRSILLSHGIDTPVTR